MTDPVAFLNGTFLPLTEARVPISDRGLLYGDGLFETVRLDNGRPFRLSAHLARMGDGADTLGIDLPEIDWSAVCAELVKRNHLPNAIVRLAVTRGEAGFGYGPSASVAPTVFAILRPIPPRPVGLRAITARTPRQAGVDPDSPVPKSSSALNLILAKLEAQAVGADEAILLTPTGQLAECSAANLFWVRDGNLTTPSLDSGCLPGLTRQLVLDELAPALDFLVTDGLYPTRRLLAADEAFVTQSSLGIVPLTEVNGSGIGAGGVGPVTAALMAAYRALVESAAQ